MECVPNKIHPVVVKAEKEKEHHQYIRCFFLESDILVYHEKGQENDSQHTGIYVWQYVFAAASYCGFKSCKVRGNKIKYIKIRREYRREFI